MRLTTNQMAALHALAEHTTPATAGAIAKQVGKTIQGISTSLGSLSRRGLVERTQRASRVTFTLTDAGAEILCREPVTP